MPKDPSHAAGGSYNSPPFSIEKNYQIELVRKAIHFCSLSIPIVYFFVSRSTALTILIPLTAAFFIVDVARYYHPGIAQWFASTFGWLLRSHEQDIVKKRLNGATYMLLSAIICVLLFPKLITVTAFAILIISDTTAALVGRKFGRHRFFTKTREGSVAFFVSSIAVVAVTPKFGGSLGEYLIGIVGGAVGTVIEAFSIHVDDNLSVPIAIGATMWLLYTAFYPSLEITKFAYAF